MAAVCISMHDSYLMAAVLVVLVLDFVFCHSPSGK